MNRTWRVYLSGEIHSDWRQRIRDGAAAADLPVVFSGPVTDHARSDGIGVEIPGSEDQPFEVALQAVFLSIVLVKFAGRSGFSPTTRQESIAAVGLKPDLQQACTRWLNMAAIY